MLVDTISSGRPGNRAGQVGVCGEIDMASYLEKLVVCGFRFQLLAVGDCLLELGGLDDHDCGVYFPSLRYGWRALSSWMVKWSQDREVGTEYRTDNGEIVERVDGQVRVRMTDGGGCC